MGFNLVRVYCLAGHFIFPVDRAFVPGLTILYNISGNTWEWDVKLSELDMGKDMTF